MAISVFYSEDTTGLIAFLFRAEAEMQFKDLDGGDIATGSYVQLGTPVHVVIRLTNNMEGAGLHKLKYNNSLSRNGLIKDCQLYIMVYVIFSNIVVWY